METPLTAEEWLAAAPGELYRKRVEAAMASAAILRIPPEERIFVIEKANTSTGWLVSLREYYGHPAYLYYSDSLEECRRCQQFLIARFAVPAEALTSY